MLAPDEAIFSYFVAENAGKMYQFEITAKRFRAHEKTMPADFDRLTKGMINGIFYRNYNTFYKSASELKYVLWPETKMQNIIIIPSGRMSTLPLEALPARGNASGDFISIEYLAQDKAISYEFSVGLFSQKRKQKRSGTDQSIFLCAPVRFPAKDRLNELPGTESEIKTIANLFPTASKEVMLYDQANEGAVKSGDITKYNYLHFATHGVVDEAEPELSRIFLNENSGDDGHLFSGEIYNLNLNAELAVLSACQTGLGKFSKAKG
jgi:CHAT domain-containing protein